MWWLGVLTTPSVYMRSAASPLSAKIFLASAPTILTVLTFHVGLAEFAAAALALAFGTRSSVVAKGTLAGCFLTYMTILSVRKAD